MNFRILLCGIVAVPLLAAAAPAAESGGPAGTITLLPGVSVPLPTGWLGHRAKPAGAPQTGDIRMAQAVDPRVTGLEEEIRKLSGTVEELNFQILQMQEQMRKMQEDNEFRFQEIEGGKAKGAAPAKKSEGEPAPAPAAAAPAAQSAETNPAASVDPAPSQTTFGTITFDQNGNVTGGSIGDQTTVDGQPLPDAAPAASAAQPDASADQPAAPPADQTTVAALPSTNDPEELYRNSYQFILSGDYSTAEAGFRDHIQRFPADAKAPDAHFWLGESLLGQKKYRDAAEVFLAANKDYPKSKKAPEMLFKLGVSLFGLNQREVACATFVEIGKRYPESSAALKERVKQEQSLAAC